MTAKEVPKFVASNLPPSPGGSNSNMMKDEVMTVKDAIHKLQLYLLDGIRDENQLSATGLLLSCSDYHDVVTERTISNICGYPLCSNLLPSEQPRKGRYRISLKEHKVYDLQETYMYCSERCLIDSRAFAASLQEERSSSLNPAKLNQVLKLFEGYKLDSSVDMGKSGDFGLSRLSIQEKADREAGEVSLEDWIGPSNAIDGYVPRKDRNLDAYQSNNNKTDGTQGKVVSKPIHAQPNVPDILSYDMDFTSAIIMDNEYSISKTFAPMQKQCASSANISETNDQISASKDFARNRQSDSAKAGKVLHRGKEPAAGATSMKSSLKTSDSKKATRSVTWADEKGNFDRQNLCECKELKDEEDTLMNTPLSVVEGAGDESYRFASAEACAKALSQAAEAVALGNSDASDAVSEAGVIILPRPHELDESKPEGNSDVIDTDPVQLKWPPKPRFSSSDLLDSEDSWYDSPPEGFNLTLSPFSTMFMALFSWISSSSLAYIYGKEEIFHEEYLSVNGREYPRKIFTPDGRSPEIKQTLAGCLSRAFPGLVSELRLPIPVSVLENGMAQLLDTMSFIDSLPSFRMKQWQVILLLFLDALSVSRIPALTPYMLDRRIHLHKVLEGAQLSSEEYEILKDLMIPLGRVPQFSTQSGG